MKILVDAEQLSFLMNSLLALDPSVSDSAAFSDMERACFHAPDPKPSDTVIGFKLTRPLITFDLETTGLDTVNDRIVTLGWHILHPDTFEVEQGCYGFNPGIIIPAEASAVHGISNDMCKDWPTFSSRANDLLDMFFNCDVAHFNGNRFDVLLLSEEFSRCGLKWPLPDTRSIDVSTIFRKKEGRSLADASQFYLHEEMQNNHDASADVSATFAVLKAQLARYPDLAYMSLQQLHEYSKEDPNSVDLAGKISKDAEGDYIFAFGKHKGKKIKDNQGYAKWMRDSDFPSNTVAWVDKILDQCCRMY